MADFFSLNSRPSIRFFLLLAGLASAFWTGDCFGQMKYPTMPYFYPYTIARAQDRSWIRSLPMEKRPDRPLHFYGNRVRRSSYSVQRPSYNPQPHVSTAAKYGRYSNR